MTCPERVDYNYTARIARVALATAYEMGGYKPAGAPTPTPTVTPTPQPTPTPDPANCTNLLGQRRLRNRSWLVLWLDARIRLAT